MNSLQFEGLDTREMHLLIDIDTYQKPFLLNDAFKDFNHEQLSQLGFYTVFFGLLTLGHVGVEKLPQAYVAGNTLITYRTTSLGKEVIRRFKQQNQDFFSTDL